ncbi:hypothetical protein RSAG8_11179, partial [Rhizoctonia solani AG-8 WAC10335]
MSIRCDRITLIFLELSSTFRKSSSRGYQGIAHFGRVLELLRWVILRCELKLKSRPIEGRIDFIVLFENACI